MPDVLIASNQEALTIVQPVTRVVTVVQRGPQGPAGPIANQDAVAQFVEDAVALAVPDYFVMHPQSWSYDQPTPSNHWVITHPLDHYPAVTVIDSAGTEWECAPSYPAPNRVVLDFNVPMSGTAQLT